MENVSRKDFLKSLGIVVGSIFIPPEILEKLVLEDKKINTTNYGKR